ncbi:LuxR C-terminal-related transcriptional regulator [Shewanella maritima]|uniref:helix-turn-helix transcriptional regulator n=1 Tax=Shewanella maritima TaxID=2520507 RepID=UPI003735FDAD
MINNPILLVDFPQEFTNQFSHIAQLLNLTPIDCDHDLLANYIEQFSIADTTAIILHFYAEPQQVMSQFDTDLINNHRHIAICPKITTELELSFMSAGFHGCVNSADSVVEKLHAIKAAQREHIHFSQAATSRYVLQHKRVPSYQNSAKILAVTTPKEQQILSLIWNGMTNEEMALKLGISINTVKMHVQNIYKKTNIKNRGQLFALATG